MGNVNISTKITLIVLIKKCGTIWTPLIQKLCRGISGLWLRWLSVSSECEIATRLHAFESDANEQFNSIMSLSFFMRCLFSSFATLLVCSFNALSRFIQRVSFMPWFVCFVLCLGWSLHFCSRNSRPGQTGHRDGSRQLQKTWKILWLHDKPH